MKKLLRALFILAFVAINSYAVTGESTILEQVRAEKVEDFKANITSIKDRLNNFILNTADLTITRKEMQVFDNLPYFFFNNFEGTPCSNDGTYCNAQTDTDGINITITDRDVSFANVLGTSPNTFVVQSFLQSTDNSRTVTSENGYTVKYPFDTKTRNFIELIRKIEIIPTAYIGITAPADITKTWYLPNGNGGFELKRYNPATSAWDSIGSTGTDGTSSVQANSEAELFQIPCLKNDKGYVIQEGKGTEYICSYDGAWNTVSTGTLNGLFNGDSTIYAMATSLIGKSGGSLATASDPFQTGVKFVFSGVKNFTKKDNSSTKGYWIDSTNTFIVGSSIADISTQSWADGSYAYIPNSMGSVHLLKRINSKWIFIADGYSEVVQGFPDMLTQQIWDKKNNQYFKYSNYVWYSTTLTGSFDNVSALTNNASGRNVFSSLSPLTTYYTLVNDCTDLTCNGTIANTYFSGITKDNLYTFYYSTNGKRKNNLIDAQTFTSLLNLYQSIADPSTGLVNGKIYSRSLDSNGNEIYKDVSNNTYYTGIVIPIPSALVVGNIVQFPLTTPVIKGETASFSGTNLILSNRTQATDWTTAPHGAGVYISGKTYSHSTANGKDFWSDSIVGDWQSSATEIFTKGSRTSFPVVTHTINALTKLVDTPNYTGTGVVSSIDNSFKQWFYSSSGTSLVNNLLDGIPTTNAYLDSNAISVGYAIQSGVVLQKCSNHWCRIGTTQVVNSSLVNSISSNIVSLIEYYQYNNCSSWITQAKGTNKNSNLCAVAGNGLIYDNCEGGNQVFIIISSYCGSKGMRVPTKEETSAWSSSGVPSCFKDYTWTSSSSNYETDNYWAWRESSTSQIHYTNQNHIRCVK